MGKTLKLKVYKIISFKITFLLYISDNLK